MKKEKILGLIIVIIIGIGSLLNVFYSMELTNRIEELEAMDNHFMDMFEKQIDINKTVYEILGGE